MKDVINSLDRLDVILDIVESSILEAEDNAINLISTQNSIITNDIKSLINERITVYKKLNFISTLLKFYTTHLVSGSTYILTLQEG